MTNKEVHDFLDFWVNKYQAGFFSVEEKDEVVDRAQMELYAEYQPLYATSQRIKDSLSPFRTVYPFGYNDTISGLVIVPSAYNFLDLLDLHIYYDISARAIKKYVAIQMCNEDTRATRLNSQVDPVTITAPIGEQVGSAQFQLYPKVQYRGEVSFLRRPAKFKTVYTTISGRVLVYDEESSAQLAWKDSDVNKILLQSLAFLGVNLKDGEILQYAELKSQNS